MKIFKAIVVEDTQIARQGLVTLLSDYGCIEVVDQAKNIQQAEQLLIELQPDLMFLDIQMPGGTAFDLLKKLENIPRIIFTTAYSNFALQAFEYPTVDYLLKPICREKLDKSIAKLTIDTPSMQQNQASTVEADMDAPEEKLLLNSKLFIKDTEQNHIVELRDISLFESCKNHTRVYFKQHRPFVHKALSQVESRLPASDFFRISRSQIVNIQHIQQVLGTSSQGYELDLGLPLTYSVSRRQSALLKSLLSL
jgi:two-component system LytT family response regulator